MAEENEKGKETTTTTGTEGKPQGNDSNVDILSIVDEISKEIATEDKANEDKLKSTMYSRDQVKELAKELIKKSSENKGQVESTQSELNSLKSDYEQQLSDIKAKMDKIDNNESGSKVTSPVEGDPHSLGDKKPLGLTEELGSHEERQDGHSNATEEYSKRVLLKWGVIRQRK